MQAATHEMTHMNMYTHVATHEMTHMHTYTRVATHEMMHMYARTHTHSATHGMNMNMYLPH